MPQTALPRCLHPIKSTRGFSALDTPYLNRAARCCHLACLPAGCPPWRESWEMPNSWSQAGPSSLAAVAPSGSTRRHCFQPSPPSPTTSGHSHFGLSSSLQGWRQRSKCAKRNPMSLVRAALRGQGWRCPLPAEHNRTSLTTWVCPCPKQVLRLPRCLCCSEVTQHYALISGMKPLGYPGLWPLQLPQSRSPSLPDKGQENFLLCLMAAKEKMGTSLSLTGGMNHLYLLTSALRLPGSTELAGRAEPF